MSVIASDVVFYGSANMPDVDGATTGGAVSTAKLINFNDITPNGFMDVVSSSASDTACTVALTGRDATGVPVTPAAITLTGTTPVLGATTFERLLKGILAGTTSVGDIAAYSHTAITTGTAQAGAAATAVASATITLQSGQGASCAVGQILRFTNNTPAGVGVQLRRIVALAGDVASVNNDWAVVPTSGSTYGVYHGMLFEKLPNAVTENRRIFYNVSSDVSGGASRTFYEKIFAMNNNTTTALTLVTLSKQVDPSAGTFEFALTNALNDTSTIANRQTLPSVAITAFTTGASPQSINVPSPQNLPSGAAPNAAGAQGIWVAQTLTAALAPAKTSATIRVAGSTT